MSYMEFTGKTVKDAIARACEELNVEESILDVVVLEESARGFLGLVGHRNARIRVRKRDILKEVLEISPAETKESPSKPKPVTKRETDDMLPETVSPTHSEAEPGSVDLDKTEIISQAKDLLEGILNRIPVEASVEVSVSNGAVCLNIMGDRSGLLIGKRGQTLDALQYIVNKAVNKESALEDKTEVIVDTEDYRRRKFDSLRDMAVRTSMKARKTLKPIPLNPMPANERRIIHMILAEDREVYTKSYGEGPLRRIIIYPRQAMTNKRRRR